jgi:tetratricopeptide (TPR) repeat protein
MVSREQSRLSVAAVFLLAVVPGAIAQHCFPRVAPNSTGAIVSVSSLRIPDKAREQVSKAVARYNKKDFAGATNYLNAALAVAPDFPAALSFRGYVELMTNHFDASESDLRHALQIDPKYGPAYLHIGSLMNHLGRYDEALLNLEKDDQFQPGSWEVPFEMAKSWLGKHDYARALEEVNRSASLGGDKIGAAIHFVRADALYGTGQYELAGAEVQIFLLMQPTGTLSEMARELSRKIQNRQPAEVAKK